MRRPEKVIMGIIVCVIVLVAGVKAWQGQIKSDVAKSNLAQEAQGVSKEQNCTTDVPFYTTASNDLNRHANAIYKQQNCKQCHLLWATRDMTLAVPAPMLDGIGSLRDEEWFFMYFSAENPQTIIPSRLKKKYRMPSFAQLPEADRRALAQYMASLKVKDECLHEVRKAEYEKLTGNTYVAPKAAQP